MLRCFTYPNPNCNWDKIVYLDQLHWINLSQQYFGRIDSKAIGKSLDAVLKASKTGNIIFPISYIHVHEASTRGDDKTRNELLTFMIKISRGLTIMPYVGRYRLALII